MIRCYVTDEPDHAELQGQILDGEVPVVTSELALVELSAAVHAAHRAGRVARPSDILNGIERDCGRGGADPSRCCGCNRMWCSHWRGTWCPRTRCAPRPGVVRSRGVTK